MSYDNPFADSGANPYGGYEPPAPSSPGGGGGTMPSWAADTTPASPGGGASRNKDFEITADSLRRKEQELNRREQELNNRERVLRETGGTNSAQYKRLPNWPRWPKPMVRQDIATDIEGSDLQALIRQAWILWHVLCIVMLWNLISMTALLIVDGQVSDFVLSIVYFLIVLPISFLIYRNLYKAARRKSALSYFVYFVFAALQVCCFIFWGIGLKKSGMAGLLWMIKMFADDGKSHKIVGFFCLVGCILWWLMAAAHAYIWIKARIHYHRRGGFQAAQSDFAVEAGRAAANNPEMAMKAGRAASQF